MKRIVKSLLQTLGLLTYLEFGRQYFVFYQKNKEFKNEHPDLSLPSAYILFESYKLDFESYIKDGLKTANLIVNYFNQYSPRKSNAVILDWGCGPGRVIRNLPHLIDDSNRIIGIDVNKKAIDWNMQHLHEDIRFLAIEKQPPLPLKNDTIDFVYGISIFTHLSKQLIQLWFNDINRVLSEDGIFLFTTHGSAFKPVLSSKQKLKFDQGYMIVKPSRIIGHRSFGSFTPQESILELISPQFEVVYFKEGIKRSWGYEQDIWVVKKI